MALADRYVPLKERFSAWWNGEEASPDGVVESPKMSIERDVFEDETDEPWGDSRIAIIEKVWGDGFLEPGGDRQVRRQLGILSLNPKQSVLDLTAGLAGTAINVADKHGLWIDALEPIPELVRAGQRRCSLAGLGKRVAISPVDFSDYRFPEKRYDAIYSRERLFSQHDKPKIISGCSEALKPGGQLLVTDFLRSEDVDGSEAVEAWAQRRNEDPDFWTFEQYKQSLQSEGLTVMPVRDITEEFVTGISSAWARVPRLIEESSFSRHQVDILMQEGEMWLQRLRALESGKVIVGRIHAQAGT